ncbi:MAG: hypothetical protein HY816_00530 [Candidatus Wallbacteria bacterium]|nr:hypothetical protein [Candidatus Wallbacteria bacterium]
MMKSRRLAWVLVLSAACCSEVAAQAPAARAGSAGAAKLEVRWVTGHFEDVTGAMYSAESRKTIGQLQAIARSHCGMVRFGPLDRLVPVAAGREFSIYVPDITQVREVYLQTVAALGTGFPSVSVGYGEWPNVGGVSLDYRKDWARADCAGVSLPLPK